MGLHAMYGTPALGCHFLGRLKFYSCPRSKHITNVEKRLIPGKLHEEL